MDERIDSKYVPYIFAHEYGHYLGEDESGADNFAKQMVGEMIN